MHFVELVSLQYCFILNVFVPDNPQPLETPSGKMETMASIKTNRGPVPHSHRHFIKAQLFQIFSNPICTSSTSKPLKNGDEIHIHLVPPSIFTASFPGSLSHRRPVASHRPLRSAARLWQRPRTFHSRYTPCPLPWLPWASGWKRLELEGSTVQP